MPPTDMTQADRERLAARLLREQRTRFSGVAKDAYTAANVNSETWRRVTHAETIKPHKLIQIVVKLWPETDGEWHRIPGLEPTDARLERDIAEVRAAVRAAREAGATKDDLLAIWDDETEVRGA